MFMQLCLCNIFKYSTDEETEHVGKITAHSHVYSTKANAAIDKGIDKYFHFEIIN